MFMFLLWVLFCCVCPARFFFCCCGCPARFVFFCCGCAARFFLQVRGKFNHSLAVRRLRAYAAERHPGSGTPFFCCGCASSLTHSLPAARSTHSNKAPTAKKNTGSLVHGWGRIKNVHFYSLLGLSTHQNINMYPTMRKVGKFG